MFGCIAEFNYVVASWKSSCVRGDSDIKYVSIFILAQHAIVAVNFSPDQLKRARFDSMRTGVLDPQPTMKPLSKLPESLEI